MIFAFVLLGIYKPENWPILSDYLVKLAGRFLFGNGTGSVQYCAHTKYI